MNNQVKSRWKITGTFTTTAPMHIGSGHVGEDNRLLSEKRKDAGEENDEVQCVVRDYLGRPCIPGTAIKGVLRAWAEKHLGKSDARLLRIFGPENCAHSGWAEFQNAFQPKSTTFPATHPQVPYWNSVSGTGIMSHVSINRETGAADDGKLFFEEFIPEGAVFQFEIEVNRLGKDDIEFLLGILQTGAAFADSQYQFGANGADGWGRVKCGELKAVPLHDEKCGVPVVNTFQFSRISIVAFNLTLTFQGPFLVNDTSKERPKNAEPGDPRTSFTALRRFNGQVWLPASSFRGALKSRAEFLAKSSGRPQSEIDELFGSTGRKARLTISEFWEEGKSVSRHQDFVAIDRFTGGAADGALYSASYADKPHLKTRMILDEVGLSEQSKALLAQALRDVRDGKVTFGFGASKGYGEATGELCEEGKGWMNAIPAIEVRQEALCPANIRSLGKVVAVQSTLGVWEYRLTSEKSPLIVQGQNVIHQLSADFPMRKLNTYDVDFDCLNGKPCRVSEAGKPYRALSGCETHPASAPATQPPPSDPLRFYNPYYFINLKDRSKFSCDLDDAPPASHAAYESGKFSGTIRVKLTTETPLLICDDSRVVTQERDDPQTGIKKGHKTYPILKDCDKPLLASSSVRGMLRSAYEAITNSRYGVFPINSENGQQRRLAFRRPAKVDSFPAIIESATPERIIVRVLSSLWLKSPAKLPRYSQSNAFDRGESQSALKYPDGTLPQSGDEVDIQVAQNGKATSIRLASNSIIEQDWKRGIVLITGANISGKRCERVFVTSEHDHLISHEGTEATRILTLWSDLIANYQNIHIDEIKQRFIDGQHPAQYLGDNLGRTAWSRHIYHPGATTLTKGMRLFVILERGRRITDLFPVSISRKLYDNSPLDLLLPSLRPATDPAQLSPADRVFGWVNQKKMPRKDDHSPEATEERGKQRARRSLLRVGRVECDNIGDQDTLNRPITLAILGEPKPAQGRFYVGDREGQRQTCPSLPNGRKLTKEEAGYTGKNRLRGPKVYPHHVDFNIDTVTGALPGSQNRTIEGYVSKSAEFSFDLHITNLSKFELGALLWLLSMEDGCFLRLGLGKPLGFGSVKAKIDRVQLADGKTWIDSIGSGSPPASIVGAIFIAETISPFITEFKDPKNNSVLKVLDDFQTAARGFPATQTHYPRLPNQQPGDGKHFEWFTKNESGQGYNLPDLTPGDPSLPRDPSH